MQIDHFAEINLAGFVELSEALGGVPVCLNAAVRDTYSGVNLPAGPQTITGPAALAFVRQRHGLEGGDLDQAMSQLGRLSGDDLIFRTIPTGEPDLRTPVDGIAVQIDQAAVREFVNELVLGTPVSGQQTSPPTTPPPTTTSAPAVVSAGTTGTPSPRTTAPPRVITADGVPCVD